MKNLSLFKIVLWLGFIGLSLGINSVQADINPATEVKVIADNGTVLASRSFGWATSLDGNRLAVGAPSGSGEPDTMAVYVYDFNGSRWEQTDKITVADRPDGFGRSISLDGDRLAVGAYDGISNNQGEVYVFDFNGNEWEQTAKLTKTNGVAGDRFALSISLDGNRLAVGALGVSIGGNNSQGAAYIFNFNGNEWEQPIELTASDGEANEYFGNSISLDGNRLAVGAVWEGPGGNFAGHGAVYVFDLSDPISSTWNGTQQKLTAHDRAADNLFGQSVSLDNTRLVVGADRAKVNGTYQGAAYVFDLSGGTWSETTKLTASNGASGDLFGQSVSLSANRLAVGAPEKDINHRGAAYIFDLSGGSWEETTKLTASDKAGYDRFGHSVSLSGKRLAVGTPGADVGSNSNQGAVYIYTDDLIFKSGFERIIDLIFKNGFD